MSTFQIIFGYIPAALLVFGWIINKATVPRPIPGIPHSWLTRWSPTGDMLGLGLNMVFGGSDFDWITRQCLKQKSPICQISVAPFSTTSPVVLISDLRTVKDIAVKRIQEFDRASIVHQWFSTIFPKASTSMTSTTAFRQQRRVWNSTVSTGFMEDVATPTFEATIRKYIKLWTIKASLTNEGFAAYDDCRRLALEGIWKVLLGCDIGLADAAITWCQEKKTTDTLKATSPRFPYFYDDFKTLLLALLWVITGISSTMYKLIFPRLPRFANAMKRTHATMHEIIQDTRQSLESGSPITRCGLSDVLQLEGAPPDEVLNDEIVELLMTGHETSATTLAWGFKFLADNQRAQQCLYKALKSSFPSSELPRGAEISKADIPYLDAILAEILRLACTAPVAFRETTTDCEVLGYHIPANTPIFLITQAPMDGKYGMITPNSFTTPLDTKSEKTPGMDFCSSFSSFIPERWLDAKRDFNPDAGLSLPFSAGKRGCFGKRLAMLEMRIIVAMMLLSFKFEKLSVEKSRNNTHDTLTRQPATCFVKPVVRKKVGEKWGWLEGEGEGI